MKVPFYTIIGPILRKNQRSIKYFCGNPALSFSPFYVLILGILGVGLSIFDIIRIIKCGPILPGFLWRERLKNSSLVAPEVERDFKLICLVFSSEYYLFLLIGLTTITHDKISEHITKRSEMAPLDGVHHWWLKYIYDRVVNCPDTAALSLLYVLVYLLVLEEGNPIFFLPFLLLYAGIILMESSIFLMRAFVEGLDFKKSSLVMSMFMVYNWMSVFCTFCRHMTGCDV